MRRSHVIRLNPTPEQEVYFRKACGVARHAYNWALSRWKDYRSEGKRVKMKELKAEQYGNSVQLVDPWYASSKTCSQCGWKDEDVTLADRTFACEACGLVIDRDLNASQNIEQEALRLLSDVPVVASSARTFACGVDRSGFSCEESETVCEEAGTGR